MFKSRSAKVSFPDIENAMLAFWEKQHIFQKSIDNRKGKPVFNFYDGPPFATGLPHYGHILAGAIKDAIPRYKTMQGFQVPRTNGWDCHGLPVEYEIEKELGLSGKPDIEQMGIAQFNEACRGIVFRYTKEWEKTILRMGRWVDFEDSYATMDRDYMESIWWVFRQIWDKGMIYQDYRSTWYCPRCGTPLSNFEVNQGYKDNIEDPEIYAKFQLVSDPNTYLLVWTTTPWTLPANAAVAIHPEHKYVKIKLTNPEPEKQRELSREALDSIGQHLILSEARLEAIHQPYEIVRTYKARELEGERYRPLYSFIPTEKKAYQILLADFVTQEDGTGIVHIAPAFGEDDFNLGKQHELPIFRTVDESGKMIPSVTNWAGVFVKDADDQIAEELGKRGLIYRYGKIRHTYPFCWRCDSPLLNYSMKTWFVSVSKLREKLVAHNDDINWVPGHIKEGRFGNWLSTARDWNISRNRFWGTPLPIWQCTSCDHQCCIGSVAELKAKAIPADKGRIDELDLHRPYVDEISLQCEKCNGTMQRIEEVLDCWFESGAMPYAQKHYPFEEKEHFEENFPAQFIAEGIDQTRGWFYTLHVIAAILFDKPSFQNVIVNGIGLDEKGVKLSKRLRNYVEPEKLMEEVGADAMRYFFFAGTPMGEDWRFSDKLVQEKMRKVLMIYWNTYVFFLTYALIDKWEPTPELMTGRTPTPSHLLDRWVLSRLNSLVGEMTRAFDNYDLTNAARPVEGFLNELSTWYVRRSRRRFWKSDNDADKQEAYATLYHCILTVAKLMAPIMPFVTEEIYQNLVREVTHDMPESIHHCDYPVVDANSVDAALEARMQTVMTIVETARSIRAETRLKVRQPCATLAVYSTEVDLSKLEEELIEIIREEINIKSVDVVDAIPDEFAHKQSGAVTVGLDPRISDELRQEGLVRDLVREIQSARKQAGFNIEDRINTTIEFEDAFLEESLKIWGDYLKQETLTDKLNSGKVNEEEVEYNGSIELGYLKIKIGIAREKKTRGNVPELSWSER